MNWKKLIGVVAPVLGTALGGPIGGIAAKAISMALGLSNSDDHTIEMALKNATPQDLLKLKQAEQDFKLEMAELNVDLEQIASDDRNSARQREMVVQDKMPAILSLLVTVGFLGVLAMIMMYPMQPGVTSIIDVMLGVLGTAWIACVTYYVGSSHGSQLKNKMLERRGLKNG